MMKGHSGISVDESLQGDTWSRGLARRSEAVQVSKRRAGSHGMEEGSGKVTKEGAKAGLRERLDVTVGRVMPGFWWILVDSGR